MSSCEADEVLQSAGFAVCGEDWNSLVKKHVNESTLLIFWSTLDSLWLFIGNHISICWPRKIEFRKTHLLFTIFTCVGRGRWWRGKVQSMDFTISDPKLQKHSSVQISTKQFWRYLGPWAILSFRFSMIVALRPPGGGCFCRFRASLAFWGKTPSWIVDSGAWNSWNVQDGSLCPPPHASAWPVCNGKRRVSSAILVICHLEVWGRGPRTTRSARVSSHAYGALVVREGRFRRTRTAEMIADGRCYR